VNSEPIKIDLSVRRLKMFVCERALPLWASAGFDENAGCFEERLDFSGAPIRNCSRRLMVQARQIVVYARASLQNWHIDKQQCAHRAFEAVCRTYRSPDGDPGWAFSLLPGGRLDSTRDLYAHAFVLYMLACVYKLTSDPDVLALADATLLDIDRIFSAENGQSYLSKVPGPIDVREQNPHMHLFEGLLALADASGAERYIARARLLIDHFDKVLADPSTGAVREVFDANWRPLKPSGENLVEPGHQMEWVWLLQEWERLTGSPVSERVQRLCTHATSFGIDAMQGFVRGLVKEGGEVASNALRVWPQTETIRALCRVDPKGVVWPGLASRVTETLFSKHLPAHLNGGWIDQISEAGEVTIDFMPASTLYHLVGAAIDGASACLTDPS
jgi:mannose/cellobiose epimerase-like protein (N-acyl-D-glucosamine 2-epimerase family)